MQRKKTLEQRQQEMKMRVLQDGKIYEEWHLDQGVTPVPLQVGKILDPSPRSLQEKEKRGTFVPSTIPICMGSNTQFTASLRDILAEPEVYITCKQCERKIQIVLMEPGRYTREWLSRHPYEYVVVRVAFHRIAKKERSKKSNIVNG